MKDLQIHVESKDEFFARAKSIAQEIDRIGGVAHPEFHFSFTTLDQFLDVITPKRWALLQRLRGIGPTSIRALAGSLGRDYKAVHTDVTALLREELISRDDKGLISVPWTRITTTTDLAEA